MWVHIKASICRASTTHDTNRNRTRIACESDVKFKAATKKKLLAALSAQSDNVRPVGSIVDRTTTRDLKLEISENSLYAMKPVIFTSVVIAATLACLATPTSGQFNRRQGMETNKTNTIEYIIYILWILRSDFYLVSWEINGRKTNNKRGNLFH